MKSDKTMTATRSACPQHGEFSFLRGAALLDSAAGLVSSQLDEVVRVYAATARQLAAVLATPEVGAVLSCIWDLFLLFPRLLYGWRLRLRAGIRFLVQGLDFGEGQVVVRRYAGLVGLVAARPLDF
jgi:hypothetical protein